ncbi:hypothetical protein V5799_020271 [Amblyomma americanum]|uniref:Uncharacterized protein n=1 Tax=Amblyomma americanum TaxID=6943 RepID=A0AAQ4EUY2_AMBAM
MDTDQTGTHLSMSVPGQVTAADVNLSKELESKDEVGHREPGECSPNNTSETSLNICCVVPGSCVYLRSPALPSTSHFLEVKIWGQQSTVPGSQFGPLRLKYFVEIASRTSLQTFQAFLQALNELTTNQMY